MCSKPKKSKSKSTRMRQEKKEQQVRNDMKISLQRSEENEQLEQAINIGYGFADPNDDHDSDYEGDDWRSPYRSDSDIDEEDEQ